MDYFGVSGTYDVRYFKSPRRFIYRSTGTTESRRVGCNVEKSDEKCRLGTGAVQAPEDSPQPRLTVNLNLATIHYELVNHRYDGFLLGVRLECVDSDVTMTMTYQMTSCSCRERITHLWGGSKSSWS